MTNKLANCTMHHRDIVKVKCDWQSNVCGMDIEDCVVASPKQFETDANKL